jgi:hypothetical protein
MMKYTPRYGGKFAFVPDEPALLIEMPVVADAVFVAVLLP